jgi:site-specific DNA recombinase
VRHLYPEILRGGARAGFQLARCAARGLRSLHPESEERGLVLVSTRYDDGGFSGGNIERPALTRLLEDIDAGKIDTVVVYKVDRLTRSLSDFAKIVDVLDGHSVSFVSITQQFNTTTSMGRLTLNMLLSFAQFEREVTGERIRDKIAASKRKGLWMGGLVPLGYEPNGRTLTVVESEAKTVRTLFKLYLELGNVRKVMREAERIGLNSKIRPGRVERLAGGRPISRGAIYHVLSNPLYIGRIRHNADSYEGQHPAIIDRKTWEAVQKKLSIRAPVDAASKRIRTSYPLAGKLIDENGRSLYATFTKKSGKRYRYYLSRDLKEPKKPSRPDNRTTRWRLNAHDIEKTIDSAVRSFFSNSLAFSRAARKASVRENLVPELITRTGDCDRDLLRFVTKVDLEESQLTIHLGLSELMKDLDGVIQHSVPFQMSRRGNEVRMVIAAEGLWTSDLRSDPALIKSVARARMWFDALASGRVGSLLEIAKQERVSDRYIGRVIPLAFLAPEIVADMLEGQQPADLTIQALSTHLEIPLEWNDQKALLGLPRNRKS